MEDLNDIYFFASVVNTGGFSAAARTIGVEKTRLSRRIAALESGWVSVITTHHPGFGSHRAASAFLSDVLRRSREPGHMTAWRKLRRNLPGSFPQQPGPADAKVSGSCTPGYMTESKVSCLRRGDGPDRKCD